jgi:hypothetical protein
MSKNAHHAAGAVKKLTKPVRFGRQVYGNWKRKNTVSGRVHERWLDGEPDCRAYDSGSTFSWLAVQWAPASTIMAPLKLHKMIVTEN